MRDTYPTRSTAPVPFQSDAEFVQFALETLVATKVERLYCEKALRDASRYSTPLMEKVLCKPKPDPIHEAEQRLKVAREAEALAAAAYTARLTTHRSTPGAIQLGLDRTAEAFDLDSSEQLILLALLAPSISQGLAERTLGGLDLRYCSGNLAVENVLVLLDAKSVETMIKARRYLHRGAKLNLYQLISTTFHSGLQTPDQFLDAQVSLSPVGFAMLLSLSPEFLAGELEPTSDLLGAKA